MKIALFIKESIDINEDLSTLLVSKISEYNLIYILANVDDKDLYELYCFCIYRHW